MSQETKIKIGKVANIIATIIFVVFIVVVFAGIPMTTTQFIVLMAVLFILFTICTIVAHIMLKDFIIRNSIKKYKKIYKNVIV